MGSRILREVEFRQQIRGYHQDDVDNFLEEVAAGIEVLQERLREANERAARAEASRASEGVPSDSTGDDAARRALDVAQRTVTLLIREAKEEARHLVSEAEARARVIIGAAEEALDRRMLEGRNQLRDDVTRLTAARAELSGQVAELEEQIAEGRRKAVEALKRALALLGEEDTVSAGGELSGGDRPERDLPAGGHDANGAPPSWPSRAGLVGTGGAISAGQAPHGSPAPVPGGPPPGPPDAAGSPADDPEATRMLRMDTGGMASQGVFDVEQADS